MNRESCKGCRFSGSLASGGPLICQYILVTGERRGCNPAHCTRYEKGDNTLPGLAKFGYVDTGCFSSGPRGALFAELYAQGMSDAEIASRCEVSERTIVLWRYNHKLPSNEVEK